MRAIYHPLDWIMLAAAIIFFVFCAARYSGGVAVMLDESHNPNATVTN